jgi:hypothetical protein
MNRAKTAPITESFVHDLALELERQYSHMKKPAEEAKKQ